MGRIESRKIEHRAAVRADPLGAFDVVLRAGGRQCRGSEADAVDRRAVHAKAVLRKPADGGRTEGPRLEYQSQASATVDAADGFGSHLSEAAIIGSSSGPSDLSVPVAEREDRTAQSGMEHGHNVRAASGRIRLPSGNSG